MKIVKNLFGYLLSGFVFWLPIWIIALVLSFVFGSIENTGRRFLIFFLPEQAIYPGFGIIIGIIIFYLTGIILKKTAAGDFFSRAPIIGMFFRRKGGETITLDRLLHLTPCLFLYSPTCPSYGWILSKEQVKLNAEKAEFTLINVYYPNVPTLITGQIFLVREETVIMLGNQSREIIDLLLYALRSPANIHYLPWEWENEEEFKKRARRFGINLSTD